MSGKPDFVLCRREETVFVFAGGRRPLPIVLTRRLLDELNEQGFPTYLKSAATLPATLLDGAPSAAVPGHQRIQVDVRVPE